MTEGSPRIVPAPVRKRVVVKAGPDRAFEVFTRDIARWWPAQHTLLKSPLKETVIEPRPLGRWYQIGEDGSQCGIGHVLVWQPPHRVVLAWQINAQWQFDPDLVTEVEVTFTAESGGRTRVELEHRLLERMGEKAAETRGQIDAPEGWTAILESFRARADSSAS